MRPLRAVLVPYSVHTGGKSEAQLTKKQVVLLMHDIYWLRKSMWHGLLFYCVLGRIALTCR